MQFVLNPKIEGLSQFFFIFLYDDIIVLIFGFIDVALRSDRLNLVYIVDNNDMQTTGLTRYVLGVEPVPQKFEAFGFRARRVDGNCIAAILEAFEEARSMTDRPYAMICDTRLFEGVQCLKSSLPMAHYVAKSGADWQAGMREIEARIESLETDDLQSGSVPPKSVSCLARG